MKHITIRHVLLFSVAHYLVYGVFVVGMVLSGGIMPEEPIGFLRMIVCKFCILGQILLTIPESVMDQVLRNVLEIPGRSLFYWFTVIPNSLLYGAVAAWLYPLLLGKLGKPGENPIERNEAL